MNLNLATLYHDLLLAALTKSSEFKAALFRGSDWLQQQLRFMGFIVSKDDSMKLNWTLTPQGCPPSSLRNAALLNATGARLRNTSFLKTSLSSNHIYSILQICTISLSPLLLYAHCRWLCNWVSPVSSFDLLNDIIMNSLTFLFVPALIEILCFQQSNIFLLMLWSDGK